MSEEQPLIRPIAIATLVAGAVDILFAAFLSLAQGRSPAGMLRLVASGPFPSASKWGTAGAAAGLAVHFVLMSIIVAVFVLAARRVRSLTQAPLRWGVIYGLITYVVMNLIVVPLRFPAAFPPTLFSVATQLFAHIVLVGLPISLITARSLRDRP